MKVAASRQGRKQFAPPCDLTVLNRYRYKALRFSRGFVLISCMRYLVKARVKPGKEEALCHAIREGSLGRGSVAGGEYLRNMQEARLTSDGVATWVEVCFCHTPLAEERPYWEEYFDLIRVKDAHARKNCRDLNGTESWACCDCDCTKRLEEKLERTGVPFLEALEAERKRDAAMDVK